jgi:hypothetical protein
MCVEEKLILSYDPLAEENSICTTNLTDQSVGCKSKKLNKYI